MSQKIEAGKYISMYGPTVGDKVRLGDTDLFIEVEKDYTVYGDECKFGGGKSLTLSPTVGPYIDIYLSASIF